MFLLTLRYVTLPAPAWVFRAPERVAQHEIKLYLQLAAILSEFGEDASVQSVASCLQASCQTKYVTMSLGVMDVKHEGKQPIDSIFMQGITN